MATYSTTPAYPRVQLPTMRITWDLSVYPAHLSAANVQVWPTACSASRVTNYINQDACYLAPQDITRSFWLTPPPQSAQGALGFAQAASTRLFVSPATIIFLSPTGLESAFEQPYVPYLSSPTSILSSASLALPPAYHVLYCQLFA